MGWGWCGGQKRGFTHDLLFLWGGILGVTTCLFLPQLKATDADEGEFGRVWYRILQGEWAVLRTAELLWAARSLGSEAKGYHPDQGGLGIGQPPAASPPEMVIDPTYSMGPSLN